MRTPRSARPALPQPTTRGVARETDSHLELGSASAAAARLALRLRVFATREKLDRQIAGARAFEVTDAFALRVRQLSEPRTRQRIAGELRGLLAHAEARRPGPVISAVVIEPRAVRAGRQAILGLAERLEAAAPVSPRGVVLARALLTDGRGAMYNPHCEQTVTEAVFAVQDALGERSASALDALAA
jgi:hypothetical protein